MARSSFDFNLGSEPRRGPNRIEDETPMRMLVIGDFSGRDGGGTAGDEYARRRPVAVDIDSFDQVLRRVAPRVTTRAGDAVEIGDLDDFHPDRLYARLPAFARLRALRERMQNPATFAEAAEAFRAQAPSAAPPEAEAKAAAPGGEGDADTLSRLLGRDSAAPPAAASPKSGIDAFIASVVAEHIQPDAPPHQAQYVAAVDAAIGSHMNAVLHDRAFQSLEALWRGVNWLVTNLELGESLKLYILDATKAELLQDVIAADANLTAAATYKTLVDSTAMPGGEAWSLVVGACEFGPGGEDIALLATLGAIAAHAGAAFIASASPALGGCDSFAAAADPSRWRASDGAEYDAWRALRRSAMAPSIGLAAPRMLLRLPYGNRTDRIASFDLDELGAAREHEAYLWGHGSLACALLVGRAFLARGWEMEPGDELDVDDLPAHTYEEDGEKHLQACAETLLSERAGQALLDRGLIPLLSYKNRNAIRVMRLQSIAEPPQPLKGPWR